MLAIQHFDAITLANTLVSLALAFVLGGVIGFERQYRQRTAGLRTNVLVAVGAALFVDLGIRLHGIYGGMQGGVHVLAYVVSGIGFIGAGVIMREGGNIRGINTAATLWGSAAVGAAAGASLVAEALLGAAFVLSANTLLRPIVNAIDRQPLDVASVEVTNTVYVIADRAYQNRVLSLVELLLERTGYPVRDLDVQPYGEREIEIEAVLSVTSVDGNKWDKLMKRFAGSPMINQAFWTPSTTD
jgi:putative Mg2+ transporter-C (MgtC) family protein